MYNTLKSITKDILAYGCVFFIGMITNAVLESFVQEQEEETE